jgi:NAD(P)-dependent dehydrogenase (short-subunit alcohol dehydrogenase family)
LKLKNKVAIVTGGGAGIGRGIVLCLAEEGANVAIVDIKKENAEQVADEVRGLGRKSLVILANVADSKQVDQVVKNTLDTFGEIDILVNNVGGESKFYYEKTGEPYLEEKEWDDTIELNLKTTMLMSRAVTPHFIHQKSGKIVNISSIGGRTPSGRGRGTPGGMSGIGSAFSPMMSYGVAKAGVIQFTLSLALQLAEYNINVNCICPGTLYTPLYERSAPRRIQSTPGAEGLTASEYFDKYIASHVPLGRGQTPEDIGRAVVFFASEDARNITAQSINVDGGAVPG